MKKTKSKKKNLGDKIKLKESTWTFSGNVHKYFDKHIQKSVPLYEWAHDIGTELSYFFLTKNSKYLDIGCSTGQFIKKINLIHKHKNINIIGIDIEKNMVNFSKKINKSKNIKILNKSYQDLKIKNFDFITSFYTFQFIHPSERQKLFDKVFNELNWGGGFLFFEKVRAPDARFQDIMSLIYSNYKLSRGFKPSEILEKSNSLRGVMEPFSTAENFRMCKRAGFKDTMTVFKYLNFEGILAIK